MTPPCFFAQRSTILIALFVRDEYSYDTFWPDHERIFREGVRLDQTADPWKSTGIGLAFCRRIIEAHGGTLTLRSAVGKGSTFSIKLRAQPSAVTPPTVPEKASAVSEPLAVARAQVARKGAQLALHREQRLDVSAPASVALLLPEITTCAPARASSIAPASPIPEPPPVIQATFPFSSAPGILRCAEKVLFLLLRRRSGGPRGSSSCRRSGWPPN